MLKEIVVGSFSLCTVWHGVLESNARLAQSGVDLPELKEIKLKEHCFYSTDNTFSPAELVMKSGTCREE